MEFIKDGSKNRSGVWEGIPVNESATEGGSGGHSVLREVLLQDNRPVKISIIAINSVGSSPPASLIIPDRSYGRWFIRERQSTFISTR